MSVQFADGFTTIIGNGLVEVQPLLVNLFPVAGRNILDNGIGVWIDDKVVVLDLDETIDLIAALRDSIKALRRYGEAIDVVDRP